MIAFARLVLCLSLKQLEWIRARHSGVIATPDVRYVNFSAEHKPFMILAPWIGIWGGNGWDAQAHSVKWNSSSDIFRKKCLIYIAHAGSPCPAHVKDRERQKQMLWRTRPRHLMVFGSSWHRSLGLPRSKKSENHQNSWCMLMHVDATFGKTGFWMHSVTETQRFVATAATSCVADQWHCEFGMCQGYGGESCHLYPTRPASIRVGFLLLWCSHYNLHCTIYIYIYIYIYVCIYIYMYSVESHIYIYICVPCIYLDLNKWHMYF